METKKQSINGYIYITSTEQPTLSDYVTDGTYVLKAMFVINNPHIYGSIDNFKKIIETDNMFLKALGVKAISIQNKFA